MQAIEIKYLNATNTKGVRIKAVCDAGSLTVSRDYELNVNTQVNDVVAMLLNKLEWRYAFNVGVLKNGNYVAVLTGVKEYA